jgi:hypothetical protein
VHHAARNLDSEAAAVVERRLAMRHREHGCQGSCEPVLNHSSFSSLYHSYSQGAANFLL